MNQVVRCHSAALVGIDAVLVEVEVDLIPGMPGFFLVGLPDQAVVESRERVRSALRHSGLSFPNMKIVCNLAPGDIRKEGTYLDLPIAAALLAAQGDVSVDAVKDTVMVGELGLEGQLRPVDGALSVALLCRERGMNRLILPAENAAEAAVIPDLEVYGIRNLRELDLLLNGDGIPPHPTLAGTPAAESSYPYDFADVKGQVHAIRALEIVAAGGHNMLMIGPPGSGKTMLARRLLTILPPLSLEESIEVTRIHSAAGKKEGSGLVWERPFRSPHHTSSYAAIVGGGKIPKPGEVSLAHHGVLFLDECAEFSANVLEALRQPLEDGVVTVSRVQASLTFPAQCMLVGAMNPCPCGLKGYPDAKCVGNPASCGKYMQRLSGPLLDRIDLHLTVPRLKPDELTHAAPGPHSHDIRSRVQSARARQSARLGEAKTNANMSPAQIRETVRLSDEGVDFMKLVASRLSISGRVYDRILKVSRTIADLAGADLVSKVHLSEAVSYREPRDGL